METMKFLEEWWFKYVFFKGCPFGVMLKGNQKETQIHFGGPPEKDEPPNMLKRVDNQICASGSPEAKTPCGQRPWGGMAAFLSQLGQKCFRQHGVVQCPPGPHGIVASW